ncbi:MAG: PAS domain-containing protein [Lentisphaeria bacterium]|nr:PAS domain-containing protein [Lentisphaeria bacterium]
MPRNQFFSKFKTKLKSMDSGSINSYIHLLSREHDFMESVFNAIREGIIIIDDSYRLVYHNAVAKEMFGIPDDFSRIRISNLIRELDWNRFFGAGDGSGRTAYHEIEILYPRRRVLNFYAVPRRDEDDQSFATLIFNDITATYDRLSSEAENERAQLITTLAAEVAHEIGNPLNSLYLNLQLLQKSLERGTFDPQDGKEMVAEAKSEVERLDHIIHQFLHALRPTKPMLNPLDIKRPVLDSLNFMRHEIEGKNITVNCLWNDSLPKIQGDADLLKQAFYNLIKNAIQAMPQGGTLSISCSSDEHSVCVDVVDQGSGISQEDAHRLFSPFFTTKPNGNGLGLMVVERIVRDHGGRLSFESRVGEGTRFRLIFPVIGSRIRVLPPPKDATGALPEAKSQGKKPTENNGDASK